ncbi:MAG TPA: discoidin domain-containing protein, partial [Flavobacterium sp.]
FPASVNCRYYRIDITANQASGNQVSNLAETGAIVKTIGDPNAYNRVLWTVIANSEEASGEGPTNGRAMVMLDQSTATFWASKWQGTPAPYNHVLTFDMKQAQPVNQLYYVPRNQLNSTPFAGSVSFSDDGTTFGTEIPVLFSATFSKNFINLPTVQNHRYFRITITKNVYAQSNPNDTTNPSFYATTMAEVGANYNTALSATLLSFTSQTEGIGVDLRWTTSAEKNSVRYDISRSADGLNFTTIGSVNTAGTTNTETNYSFTDASPLTGRNYYRLELATTDGPVQKSNTINTGFPAGNFTTGQPKNLNVIYFIPSDLAAVPDFESRLSKILLNMQDFYSNEMQRNGRGAKTFGLVKDVAEQKVKLIVINGKMGSASYPYSGGNGAVQSEIEVYKATHAEDFTGDHSLVIIPAYTYSANGEPSGGPFYGVGKICYALDYPDQKQELLGTGGVLGARATKWIGGFAHELGHGLNLPHNHAKVSEEPPSGTLGTTLMGAGNYTYGNAPTFLSAADCAALNNNQIFNDGSINYYGATTATVSSINAFFSPEKNAIIISGGVTSTGSPATDVSFYNDANFKNADGTFNGYGGNKDYEAVTWNSRIIGTDSLYIEMPISDFQYKGDTEYELRLRTVLQNGNIHTNTYNYAFVNNIPVLNFGKKQWITKKDWTILANSEDPASADENMIDGSNSTVWTPVASTIAFPYSFKVDMKKAIDLAGITLTNRSGNLNDAPRAVDVEISPDGETWTTLRSNFELPK